MGCGPQWRGGHPPVRLCRLDMNTRLRWVAVSPRASAGSGPRAGHRQWDQHRGPPRAIEITVWGQELKAGQYADIEFRKGRPLRISTYTIRGYEDLTPKSDDGRGRDPHLVPGRRVTQRADWSEPNCHSRSTQRASSGTAPATGGRTLRTTKWRLVTCGSNRRTVPNTCGGCRISETGNRWWTNSRRRSGPGGPVRCRRPLQLRLRNLQRPQQPLRLVDRFLVLHPGRGRRTARLAPRPSRANVIRAGKHHPE